MVTTTAWIRTQNNPLVHSGFATIDSGATATLAIPCGGRGVVRIGIPSVFTGTALTFTVQPFPPADPASPTLAPPFRLLTDGAGGTVTKVVAADTVLEVPELSGCYAFTIISNATEGQADALEVQMVGDTPVPFDASVGISAAAGSLTGATLAANVVNSSLTSVGELAKYNGIATAGYGVPAIYGVDNRLGRTTADGSPITIYAVPAGAGKLFRITIDINATAFTSGTATYTIGYTENGQALTLAVTATVINTLGTGTDLIHPDGGTNITAQLTGVFVATLSVGAVAERLA